MKISAFGLVAIAMTAFGTVSAAAQDSDIGEQTYNQYCATCHGVGGTGDGALTELLTSKPADLTQLTAQNDGVFPMLHVIHVIDGRTGLRGHGGADMPVYGALFDEENAAAGFYGAPIYTRGRILSLAYYLEQLQAE